MLAMALHLKVVLAVIRLRNPQDRSIEVLLDREDLRYLCWLVTE
jgi:hypothetical protein